MVVAWESVWMHAVWRLSIYLLMHVMTLAHVVWSLAHLALVMHVWICSAHVHHSFMSLRWSKLSNLGLIWIFITEHYSVDWILPLPVFISSSIRKLIIFVKHVLV